MSKPNILLICTDQQRYDAVRAYGNPEIDTPNLDRLAAEGALFEQCYVQSPVCAPSRASLMSGQYVHSHGLWANGVDMPSDSVLFSRLLADEGYDCGLVGKFHLGACEQGRLEPRVDDGFRVFRWAHDPYAGSSENAYHRWLRAAHPDLYAQAMANPSREKGFDTLAVEGHYSRWVGNETIDFLSHSREDGRPFFFVANFFDPHHGFGAPEEYVERYRGRQLQRPVTRDEELAGKPAIQTEASKESYAGHARGYVTYSEDELAEVRATYYGMVTLVDDEVGRILAALEECGLADDTIVIFTSDHGEMLGDHQLMLKGPMLYDCAVRVPLIMRWPGRLPAGTRVPELVEWVDLSATLLSAAGAPALTAGDGRDLVPIATGDPDATPRGWALCEYRNSGHPYDPAVHLTMLRVGHWKLIVHHGDPATTRARDGELYDLQADPFELDNLWHHPGHAEVRAQLQQRLLDVLVATEDRSQPRISNW